MPTFRKELVKGASFELTPDAARAIRMWKAKDIDLANTPDAEAMVKVWDALVTDGIQMGQSLSTARPDLVLSRVRILPVLERHGKDAWVELEYFSELGEFLPTTYILRDSSIATQRQTYRIPGTNKTIKAKFNAEMEEGYSIENVTQDLILGNFYMPARQISVTALRNGRPSTGFQTKMCHVNDAEWPSGNVTFPGGTSEPSAAPLPKGYWLLSEYRTDWYRNTGQTLITATASSRVIEDWSEVFYVRNHHTGKRPFGELSEANQTTYMTTLLGSAYAHGEIASVNGAVRVGPYPVTSFSTLFGF